MQNFGYRAAALAVAAALGLAACGGETSTEAGVESAGSSSDGADAVGSSDPEAVAEANLPLLEEGETVLDHQVLDVADGSISTLGDVVDGDRPVLLWFFSPH